MMNCANERSGILERMFAVAVRDGDDLFLWIQLRRAASNGIYYVLPTGREDDQKWKKWNPHGSWHKDGSLHHKSVDEKVPGPSCNSDPTLNSRALSNIISRPIKADEPRAFGVHCDRLKFSDVMEIPAIIISQKRDETYYLRPSTWANPVVQPMLMGGQEKILMQRVFNDAIPHITVTVYSYGITP